MSRGLPFVFLDVEHLELVGLLLHNVHGELVVQTRLVVIGRLHQHRRVVLLLQERLAQRLLQAACALQQLVADLAVVLSGQLLRVPCLALCPDQTLTRAKSSRWSS